MKYILSIFILFTVQSCIFDSNPFSENVHVAFTLSDTAGTEKYVFNEGEEFVVHFKLENKSGEELTFYTSMPIAAYEVLQGDSVIARSTDYMDYIAVMISGKIKDGDSFEDSWKGPNSGGRIDEGKNIILKPGKYSVKVLHKSFFNEYQMPETKALVFDVIE